MITYIKHNGEEIRYYIYENKAMSIQKSNWNNFCWILIRAPTYLPAMNNELCVHVMLSKAAAVVGTGGGDG